MQPVRAHHQVKPVPPATKEGHIHARVAFLQACDAVAEDVLRRIARGLMEYPCQVTAQNLQLSAGKPIGHARYLPVVPVDDRDRANAGLQPLYLRQQAHTLQHPH